MMKMGKKDESKNKNISNIVAMKTISILMFEKLFSCTQRSPVQ